MKSSVLKQFSNPGSEYRGAPFWAWNGKLEPEKLRKQIRIMEQMGLGGFFMHSRVGMATEYLGKDWFDCVDACVDEAAKHKMKAWMYDEDRWPSGAAGGLVTKNPKFRARSVLMRQVESWKGFKWDSSVLAVFAGKVQGGVVSALRSCRKGGKSKLSKGESLLVFQVQIAANSDWYNGYTYLDTLSHEAVREFIKVTHEAYRKNCSKAFGKEIPGIFTDEPNYCNLGVLRDGAVRYPWTMSLPAAFRKRYGYDIVRRLPELFFDVDGVEGAQVRWNYLDCITWLFTDAFARQIGEWCDRNGVLHTGHVLMEETLSSQTSVVGSAMRFYEYMQAPGMDSLTQYKREYDTAKQVSSVARQFGRKWRLTEIYGCTGWGFPFEGHKAVGDWHVALGINLRAQHLYWYTMLGQAKRDYPASIAHQSPWWKSYRKVEDYFARLNLVMTQGEEVRDVLVISPVESMWTLARHDWNRDDAVKARKEELNMGMVNVRDVLLGANIDFDYGDEDILARHAKVRKDRFVVGRGIYKAIVVPPMKTIRNTTLSALKRFKAAGGVVVFAGEIAGMVDAMPSADVRDFANGCICVSQTSSRIAGAVECGRRLSITDDQGVQISSTLYQLREDSENACLFVVNTGEEMRQYIKSADQQRGVAARTMEFPAVNIEGFAGFNGRPVEMDPDTGELMYAEAKRSGAGWCICTSLPRLGSRLFIVPRKAEVIKAAPAERLTDIKRRKLGAGKVDVLLSEQNNVVLDTPVRYRIGEGQWQSAKEILRIDREVREYLGIRPRGGQMCQPWVKRAEEEEKSVSVELDYEFNVEVLPGGPLHLALEKPETFDIAVNGVPVSGDMDSGWWVDESLKTLATDAACLKMGGNTISMKCRYTGDHPGLEAMYLLGMFGVKIKGCLSTITELSKSLAVGDWGKQGLPFYSGNVSYLINTDVKLGRGERAFVRVPKYDGVACRILVDGCEAGVAAWAPNEVEITKLVPRGKCLLTVEVLGSRRNSHGPLHLSNKAPRWTGPGEFITKDANWSDDYVLAPMGLKAAPELIIRRRA